MSAQSIIVTNPGGCIEYKPKVIPTNFAKGWTLHVRDYISGGSLDAAKALLELGEAEAEIHLDSNDIFTIHVCGPNVEDVKELRKQCLLKIGFEEEKLYRPKDLFPSLENIWARITWFTKWLFKGQVEST